jgi:hypothetical protein
MDVFKLGGIGIYIVNNVTLSMQGPTEPALAPAQLWGIHMIKVNIHLCENLRSHSRFVFEGYLFKLLGYCLS